MTRTPFADTIKSAAKRAAFKVLSQRVANALVRKRLPRTGQLEVTTLCNLACPLCVTHQVPREDKLLSQTALENIIRGSQGNLRLLCLHLMGEPLLHPRLFDLIHTCTEAAIETTFSTNGVLLEQHAAALLDSGLAQITIAIDGADQEAYGRYRKGGNFETVVAGTRALLEKKRARGQALPHIAVQTIMFSYNEDNQEPIKKLQRELGADSTATKRPSYFYDPEAGRRYGLEEPPAQQQVAAEEFLSNTDSTNDDREFARKAAGGTPLRELPMCPQLERLNVLCDGRVVACCMDAMGVTTFGNVNNEPFEDIWRGEAHRKVIERFQCGTLEPCEFCTLRQ